MLGGFQGLRTMILRASVRVTEQHTPWLAAGLSRKGHPDSCSCRHGRCDLRVWFDGMGMQQRTPRSSRRTGTLSPLPGFKGVFHPRRSPEQITAYAKLFLAFVCVIKPVELLLICDPDFAASFSRSRRAGWLFCGFSTAAANF